MDQRELINRAPDVLAMDERIVAAWLQGSFASGEADRWSDVDLHCLVTDQSAEWFRTHWPETAAALAGELVLAQPLPGLIGGFSITPDWLHLDLIMHPRSGFDPNAAVGLEPLYDRSGDMAHWRPHPRTVFEEPYFPERTITLFLYYLGNAPVGVGRGELVHFHGSVFTWRELLIELMLAENGIRDRGGKKRLTPYLADEQREFLESIPVPGMDMDQILASLRVIAREVLRRGKSLAQRTAATWPQELEVAAISNVQRHLGLDFGQ